ncbi:CsbD family protein [Nocardia sp. NPDC058658]|uniref:CsbD family protein n=1 Tax=unclassified Nocardia TaxID=2637762 RepID=UPI00366646D4
MSLADKAKHKAEELVGKAKEATGKTTDDRYLEHEGRTDQTKANLKGAGEKVKDAFRD